jgi:hypothetical protein
VLAENGNHNEWFQWGGDTLIRCGRRGRQLPSHRVDRHFSHRRKVLEPEQITSISRLTHRAELALKDRKAQEGYLQSLQLLRPEMDYLQRCGPGPIFGGAGRADENDSQVRPI